MESCKVSVASPDLQQSPAASYPEKWRVLYVSYQWCLSKKIPPGQDAPCFSSPAREQPQLEHAQWSHYSEQSPSTARGTLKQLLS